MRRGGKGRHSIEISRREEKEEMGWHIRSKTSSILTTIGAVLLRPLDSKGHHQLFPTSICSGITNSLLGFRRNWRCLTIEDLTKGNYAALGLDSQNKNPAVRLSDSIRSPGVAKEFTTFEAQKMPETDGRQDFFDEMKQRFLNFKKNKYLKEMEHFQTLAEMQSPKSMVIACVDSRVCPSNVLGFQPGEAFMVRNVANLVPPLENGPTETNAALEFAVNTLAIKHIFVIGHSCCAGIQALMSVQDDKNSSLIEKWVAIAKVAKLRTKVDVSHLSFDQQCKHCEKESINCSLLNLLTYPWIKDRVRAGSLFVHGGYYDFLNCSFEKWTLDSKGISSSSPTGRLLVKDRAVWY